MTAHHGRNSPEDMYALGVASTIGTAGRSANPSDTIALEPARCITARSGRDGASSDQTFALADPVFAFDYQQLTSMENRATVELGRPTPTISSSGRVSVAGGLRPRRLTPREVERCFGFADGYTAIPKAKDASRYKALGNSMAVPVLAWLGRRMQTVETLIARGKQ